MKNTIILIIFCVIICDCSNRVKRKVLFRKNSKFFVRLNGKEPVLNFTTIFQHGWGFRLNFDLPDTIPKLHKLYKRDIKNYIQPYLKRPELQSYFCLLKYFANKIYEMDFNRSCGVVCEIAKIVRNHDGDDSNFFSNVLSYLKHFEMDCPEVEYQMSLDNNI